MPSVEIRELKNRASEIIRKVREEQAPQIITLRDKARKEISRGEKAGELSQEEQMTFEIVLAASARKTLDRLLRSERKRFAGAILRLKDDPRPPGKKIKRLKAVDGELLRLRVGDKL